MRATANTIGHAPIDSRGALALLDLREYSEALARIRETLALPPDTMPEDEQVMLEVLSSECLAFLGRHHEAIEVCEKYLPRLRSSHQHSTYGRACLGIALAQYFLGNLEAATEYANVSHYAFKRVDDVPGIIKALNWVGNIVFYRGQYHASLEKYEECIRLANQHGLARWEGVASLNAVFTYALLGQLSEARETLEDCRVAVVHAGDRITRMRFQLADAFVHIQQRSYALARTLLTCEESHVFSDSHKREQGSWCEYMGELELCSGNYVAAARHLLHGIELASTGSPDESVIGQSRRLLAEVRLAQGNLDEALAEGERALVSIRRVGERLEEGVVLRLFGEAHARRGQAESAHRAFASSIEILREIGARLEWAKSCLAAGSCTLFAQRDRLGYLIEAERLFEAVGIDFWIDATRIQLEQLLSERIPAPMSSQHVPVATPSTVFVTEHPETRELINLVGRLAQDNIAILITGETGTGKDQLARYIHAISPRRDRPFVEVDLGVIPESLWESELFGTRRGAYTGANSERAGLLESANGGTVFLNEIGNLPVSLQTKLLEFLDTRQIRRLGAAKPLMLDVRLIAATNLPLLDAVARGVFRADLYYRLEEAPVHLRPLRERREDILPLIRHFLAEFGVREVGDEVLCAQPWLARALAGYWKGNARQVRNFVRRLVVIAQSPRDPEFSAWAERLLDQMDQPPEPETRGRISRERLIECLDQCQWNQRAAARLLGITEGGVRHLMKRMAIERPVMLAARFGT
jgi:DNA-binding NtrC family response regulator